MMMEISLSVYLEFCKLRLHNNSKEPISKIKCNDQLAMNGSTDGLR